MKRRFYDFIVGFIACMLAVLLLIFYIRGIVPIGIAKIIMVLLIGVGVNIIIGVSNTDL